MEDLVMFEIYEGKKVLVTGHCGFKGVWACRWLKVLGAEVIGYGHQPNTEPSHHRLLMLNIEDVVGYDLLDYSFLEWVIKESKPDLVIHLAAKAIVARTFTEPRETFENNIMGAVNILEACRLTPSVKGIVFITTDKVYSDENWAWGYRENDKLGGIDPYSASKVCCETVIECYRKSFGLNIATARAGNVIGGGDWSYKRLIPDIVRATAKGEPVVIHRASVGAIERTMAFLIEKFKGAFPVWLSPIQTTILPISEKSLSYAEKLLKALKEKNIRAELDKTNETIGKKIRNAEISKIPYMLIVGERETENKTVSVRRLKEGNLGASSLSDFISKISSEISEKK